MSRHVVFFYSTKDAYGEFSNFAAFPIEIDGRIWPTSEHYFQAQKFAGTEHEELIRTTPSPMTVAKIGRDRKRPLGNASHVGHHRRRGGPVVLSTNGRPLDSRLHFIA